MSVAGVVRLNWCAEGRRVVLVSLDQSLGHFHAVAAKSGLRQALLASYLADVHCLVPRIRIHLYSRVQKKFIWIQFIKELPMNHNKNVIFINGIRICLAATLHPYLGSAQNTLDSESLVQTLVAFVYFQGCGSGSYRGFVKLKKIVSFFKFSGKFVNFFR